MTRKVLVLGSTGSIGEQALEVIAGSADLEVCGLSANTDWQSACGQARVAGTRNVAMADSGSAAAAEAELGFPVAAGEEGVRELIAASGADIVLNAISGSAGLGPTIVALSEGIDLALANKESLVVGGELVMTLAEASGSRLIPVDSEHSALHQLIAGRAPGEVDRLVLTASGGPFRERQDLSDVTVEEALRHPTWQMGGRITIDSATLFNKGLETIEAHHLFGVPYDRIAVVVHPQSIVHAMVDLADSATLAHLGYPDMRVPISYALHHPDRAPVEQVARLDLAAAGHLDFEPPDESRFRCLTLAREAGKAGGTAPCVLNAADEIAVAGFLAGAIPFTGITEIVESVLEAMPAEPVHHFDQLFAADEEARERAGRMVEAVGV